jgi:hypothetical protein
VQLLDPIAGLGTSNTGPDNTLLLVGLDDIESTLVEIFSKSLFCLSDSYITSVLGRLEAKCVRASVVGSS